MSSKAKGLIVGGVFLLCLIAVLAVLKLTEPKPTDDSSVVSSDASSSTVLTLYEFDSDEIEKIVVSNSSIDEKYNGRFTVVPTESGFTIEEIDDFSLSTSYISALANCATKITPKTLVEENAEELAKYGLEEPLAQFTADFGEQTKTILIGIESPESGYNYVCEEGSRTVYTVLTNNLYYFFATPETFVRTAVLETPADDAWPHFDSLTVSRPDLDYDIVLVADDEEYDENSPSMVAAQMMIEPIFAYLDVTHSSEITHGMWGLTAYEAMVLHPDELDLQIAGLDNPTAVVDLVCDGGDIVYKLTIGSPIYAVDDDGAQLSDIEYYYGYFDGIDVIFKFEASEVWWASFGVTDITSSLMTGNYVNDIDYISVEVTDGDNVASYMFDVTYDDESADITATLDGKALDVDTFKDFYIFFLKSPGEELCFDEPTTSVRTTIKIVTLDGGGDTLEFFDDSNRRNIVKINGTPSYRQTTAYLEQFIDNINRLANDESLITVW